MAPPLRRSPHVMTKSCNNGTAIALPGHRNTKALCYRQSFPSNGWTKYAPCRGCTKRFILHASNFVAAVTEAVHSRTPAIRTTPQNGSVISLTVTSFEPTIFGYRPICKDALARLIICAVNKHVLKGSKRGSFHLRKSSLASAAVYFSGVFRCIIVEVSSRKESATTSIPLLTSTEWFTRHVQSIIGSEYRALQLA
jgi:hypothetical protein